METVWTMTTWIQGKTGYDIFVDRYNANKAGANAILHWIEDDVTSGDLLETKALNILYMIESERFETAIRLYNEAMERCECWIKVEKFEVKPQPNINQSQIDNIRESIEWLLDEVIDED